jgi:hypothetical protein
VLRSRQRGQSVIEFGIIAILFTLIMFAICDFGLLLNDWLTVSSATRSLAREAAVGAYTCEPMNCPTIVSPPVPSELWDLAKKQAIPGISNDSHFVPNDYCCTWGDPGSPLQLKVVYYDQCMPTSTTSCDEVDLDKLDSRYSSSDHQGRCDSWSSGIPCAHPSPPKSVPCGSPVCPGLPGDSVVVTLRAAGAQVITPLVRPFFSSAGQCPDNSTPSHCYVNLSSTVSMRFEGDVL